MNRLQYSVYKPSQPFQQLDLQLKRVAANSHPTLYRAWHWMVAEFAFTGFVVVTGFVVTGLVEEL